MENACHKPLETTGDTELTAELTEMEPWDSIVVSSKNSILSSSQCSEEHVLKCTFKACDPEQTGEVSVFRIIEYLQEMTGQSCEDWRFQSLYTRLDPEEKGIAVDFPTFHRVMKDWIADCRQDGEEAADLMNSIKDLRQGNKQLAVQNIKLQRTIEAAEELNLRLSEEIAELKGKLRGTQQALEQARALANELEDLKSSSRSLEEENSKLRAQGRQLEKELQCLLIQLDNLQEENRKLLLEKESCKNKIKQLCTERAKMKSQLCECENLISCRDNALNKKEKRTEELTVTLDEYQMMVQELKLEVNRLQEQLCHSQEDGEGLPRKSLENVKTCCIQAQAQPLSMEIEESQKQEFGEEDGLPSPLCGTKPSFATCGVAPEECRTLTEDLTAQSVHIILKFNGPFPFLVPTSEFPDITDSGVCVNGLWSTKAGTGIVFRAECTNLPEITAVSSAEQSEPAPEEQALVPVYYELTPTGGKKACNKWFASLMEGFLDIPLWYLLLHTLQKVVLLGLLLACVTLLAIVYLVLPYGHIVWAESRRNPWPQLQLRYLRPPPI